MMNEKLDWTQKLGDAFLAQQKDVMDAVQRLRSKAQTQGNLKTTKEQTVIVEQPAGSPTTVVKIEPANPQVFYVPTYNPTVVYGAWPYPAYPPYSYYPPGYVAATSIFSFGVGMAVGSALWGDCDWGRGDVDINVNGYNSFNRTNITDRTWEHSAEHRKGVIKSLSDIAGKRVAVIPGTTTENMLAEALQKANIEVELVRVRERSDGIAALENGGADAYASDRVILINLALTSKDPKKLALAEQYLSYEPYGLMLRRGDADFRLAVNLRAVPAVSVRANLSHLSTLVRCRGPRQPSSANDVSPNRPARVTTVEGKRLVRSEEPGIGYLSSV